MQYSRLMKLLFTICLISMTLGCDQNSSESSFFFVHVTDPQFGMFEPDKGFEKETELYLKAVNAINRLDPDFVVITGDLVNNMDNRSQVAEFKRITALFNRTIPIFYSPGNHDIGQSPAQEDIDSFISDYGHDRFSYKHKNSLFIGLNSCIIKSATDTLEQLQYDWLKNELSDAGKMKHKIVLTHYPFFIDSADEEENYSNIPVDIRTRYLKLFNDHNVDAVFSGHLHKNSESRHINTEFVITSSVGKPLGEAPSGIRIIKVYPDSVQSEYYGFDEIPEKISMK